MAATAFGCLGIGLIGMIGMIGTIGTIGFWGVNSCQAQAPENLGPSEYAAQRLANYLEPQLETLHVPGVAIAVVRDGRMWMLQGFGLADRERQLAVHPVSTHFSVASVSKVVTATAVMQQVEWGGLALEEDVNQFLRRFKVPQKFGTPITLTHLLTHTAGLDLQFTGMMADWGGERQPLGDYLARHLPVRINPPNERILYSNHGLALAGYLVEEVTDLDFTRYVRTNLLDPLGMATSGFEPELRLHPDLARGYEYRDGDYRALDRGEHFNPYPAGDFISTAADMARFLRMLLAEGELDGVRVLAVATARRMQEPGFRHHPELPGFALGFAETFLGGRRGLWHHGNTPGTASLFYLSPDDGFGLFVVNNGHSHELNSGILQWLLAEQPAKVPRQAMPTGLSPDESPSTGTGASGAGAVAGRYQLSRYGHRTIEKLQGLLGDFHEVRIDELADGVIHLQSPDTRYIENSQWQPVEEYLYRRRADETATGPDIRPYRTELAQFLTNDSGEVTHLALGVLVLDRLAWYELPEMQRLSLGIVCLVALAVLGYGLYWFIRWGLRIRGSRLPRVARGLAGIIAALDLVFLAGLAWLVHTYGVYGLTPGLLLYAIFSLPILSRLCSLLLPAGLVALWADPRGSGTGLGLYILLMTVQPLFVLFLWQYNLLGFHF